MRPFLLVLAAFLLIPQIVHAQIFVSEYNLTYTLGESGYDVEEVMKIKNGGNVFTFPSQIEIFRGDAKEMQAYSSLRDSSFSVNYDEQTRFVLSLRKVVVFRDMILALKYKRTQGLSSRDTIKQFAFRDLGIYPLSRVDECFANFNQCRYSANIRILTPRGYQFGNVTPSTESIKEGDREALVYKITILENISLALNGFPISLEYADYKTFATSELTAAKSMLSQSYFTINDANMTLINAGAYDVDLRRPSSLLEEAYALYKQAERALVLGEKMQATGVGKYYEAYVNGVAANDLLRQANGKAAESKNLANYEVQNALEKRITTLGANLSQEYLLRENITKALTENLSQRLMEMEASKRVEAAKPPPTAGRNYYAIAFFALLGGLMLYGVASIVLFVRREAAKSRGTVTDFRVIGDLKRKSFKGFEQKVDTVKQEVGFAAEIRKLRKDREKYTLGIENLRKKKVEGGLSENRFHFEKEKFEEEIADIDAKIEALEAQLKETKEKRPDEAGKAD